MFLRSTTSRGQRIRRPKIHKITDGRKLSSSDQCVKHGVFIRSLNYHAATKDVNSERSCKWYNSTGKELKIFDAVVHRNGRIVENLNITRIDRTHYSTLFLSRTKMRIKVSGWSWIRKKFRWRNEIHNKHTALKSTSEDFGNSFPGSILIHESVIEIKNLQNSVKLKNVHHKWV